MAGDVFDTPHPPHDALEVYYNFLERMGAIGKKVFVIAGNHDSGRFLQAPHSFLKSKGINVVGRFPENNKFNSSDYVFNLEKDNKLWSIHLLPFFRSHEVLDYVQKSELISSDEFPRMVLEKPEQLIELGIVDVLKSFIESEPKKDISSRILVSHHLFGGFSLAGSEQSVSISGLDGLPTSLWGLPYQDLALGHIHQTQRLREQNPRAIYPGSPIRFRFNEKREKKVSILSWSEETPNQEYLEIPEFRPVISINVTQENIKETLIKELSDIKVPNDLSGLLEIKLKASGAIAGLADDIRLMLNELETQWELLSLHIEGQNSKLDDKDKAHAHLITNFSGEQTNMEELFRLFYKKRFPDKSTPPEQLIKDFKSLILELEGS